jgi:hypothetical protein
VAILFLAVALFAYPACAQTPTLTDVFVSTQNASLGSAVTLTATVDSLSTSAGGISAGTVSFYDCAGGEPIAAASVTPAIPANLFSNSDGLVDWTPVKVSKDGVMITSAIVPGAPDPAGGNGASHLVLGNTSEQGIYVNLPAPASLPSGPYTFSFWMRTVSGATDPYTEVDLGPNSPSGLVDVDFPVTSTWARYSVTYPSLQSIEDENILGLYLYGFTTEVYIWGLQLEAGSAPGPYDSTSYPRSSFGGGVASATVTSSLSPGSHAIYAVYSGSSANQSSTSGIAWVWVKDGTALIIGSSVLPIGTVYLPYSVNLEVVGGQPPYTWSLPGSLPGTESFSLNVPGLQMSSSGFISGTPTITGEYQIIVDVIDVADNTAQATLFLSISELQNICRTKCGAMIPCSLVPQILTVSTDTGAAGTPVTITGLNLGNAQDYGGVYFNGVPGIVQSWSDKQIVVPVPANATTGWLSVNINYIYGFYGSETITPEWFVVDEPGGAGGSCIIADDRPRPWLPVSSPTPEMCRPEPDQWR